MELLGAMPFSQGWSSVSTGDSMVMMYRYVYIWPCACMCIAMCVDMCMHVCVCVCVWSVLFYEIHALSHKLQLPWLLSLLSCSVGV